MENEDFDASSIEINTPDSLLTDASPDTASPTPDASATPDMPDADPGAGEPGPDDVTDDGQPKPPTEDREFTLSDGSKITESELAKLRAGSLKAEDYTRKTQELAEERRRVEQEKADLEKARAAEKETPPNVIDPFKDGDRWQGLRTQQYVEAYRQEGRDVNDDATRREIRQLVREDWLEARQNVMYERGESQRVAEQQRAQAAEVERQRVWLDKTVSSHLSKDQFKGINDADGRDDVNAHLALIMQQKGEVTEADIVAAVAKVHGRWNARVSGYVQNKNTVSKKTGPIARSGGQAPVQTAKQRPADLDSLRDIGRDLGGG